jgi:hypothetical protein
MTFPARVHGEGHQRGWDLRGERADQRAWNRLPEPGQFAGQVARSARLPPARCDVLATSPQFGGSSCRVVGGLAPDAVVRCTTPRLGLQEYGTRRCRHRPVHWPGQHVPQFHLTLLTPSCGVRLPTSRSGMRITRSTSQVGRQITCGNTRSSMHLTRPMCQCHYGARRALYAGFVPYAVSVEDSIETDRRLSL